MNIIRLFIALQVLIILCLIHQRNIIQKGKEFDIDELNIRRAIMTYLLIASVGLILLTHIVQMKHLEDTTTIKENIKVVNNIVGLNELRLIPDRDITNRFREKLKDLKVRPIHIANKTYYSLHELETKADATVESYKDYILIWDNHIYSQLKQNEILVLGVSNVLLIIGLILDKDIKQTLASLLKEEVV